MAIHNTLILVLWLILLAYWGIMAVGAKRTLGGRFWRREGGLRLAILALAALTLRLPGIRHVLGHAEEHSVVIGAIGVALCALGIGLAIWARTCLGRNWGMPMSRKEDPELVTSGPYAMIRHPVYMGILIAILGSVLGENVLWALPLLLFAAYFIYSAQREETLMTQLFPDAYPAYAQRTWMLVPFLF